MPEALGAVHAKPTPDGRLGLVVRLVGAEGGCGLGVGTGVGVGVGVGVGLGVGSGVGGKVRPGVGNAVGSGVGSGPTPVFRRITIPLFGAAMARSSQPSPLTSPIASPCGSKLLMLGSAYNSSSPSVPLDWPR